MFVYSLKASTIRFCAVITLSLALIITLIAFIPTYDPTESESAFGESGKIVFGKVKTNDDRIAFLSQFGWEVAETPDEEEKVTVPSEFDKIFMTYNEMQKKQGLDLGGYRGREVTRYTYSVTNYPGYEGKVYANLLICKNKVIAGDICSADADGFIHGFSR